MFLADLSTHPPVQQWSNSRPWTRTILSPLLLILGLCLASYPEKHHEWSSWSSWLKTLSTYILPEGHDTARFFTGFGLEFITLSIIFSPRLKDLLSNRYFLWLGKQSFGVYLIHGPLLRWILAWCLYGITLPAPVQDEKHEWRPGPNLKLRGPLVQAICIPPWLLLLYALAHLWTKYVDPLCARWTAAIEKYVWANGSNEKTQQLPQ
jgi:peptidoglycan/LPS O-acetylase OafA/YrhL